MCFSRERQKLFDSVVTNSGFDLDAVNGWEGEIWCGCAVGRLPVIDPLPPPPLMAACEIKTKACDEIKNGRVFNMFCAFIHFQYEYI